MIFGALTGKPGKSPGLLGLLRAPRRSHEKGLLPERGSYRNNLELFIIIFWALAGIFCKSPGHLQNESVIGYDFPWGVVQKAEGDYNLLFA